MDEFSIFILLFMSIPMVVYLIEFYLKIRLESLKQKEIGVNSEIKIESIQSQLEHLIIENEVIKEELRDIKHLLHKENKREHISFEKEQMRLDNKTNKFEY